LAQLGLKSLDELVGHADFLQQRDTPLAKTSGLDLSFLTTYAGKDLSTWSVGATVI
jgi:glutamate synthase (ferredoxin)